MLLLHCYFFNYTTQGEILDIRVIVKKILGFIFITVLWNTFLKPALQGAGKQTQKSIQKSMQLVGKLLLIVIIFLIFFRSSDDIAHLIFLAIPIAILYYVFKVATKPFKKFFK